MTNGRRPSSALTALVVSSRYMPVYLALLLLLGIAAIWAPATLTGPGLNSIAPFGTFLAIASLGQMLVIMTGGIDLSVPGTFTMGAIVMVGVSQSSGDRIWIGVVTVVAVAALIGLVNGVLIGGLNLNALIVTLAVGQVVAGLVNRYHKTFSIQSSIPEGFSDWMSTRFLGVTRIFWIGVVITILLIIGFRYTTAGRKFQAIGANPTASRVNGLRVNLYQISAYIVAAVLYAIAGMLLAAVLRIPGVTIGGAYLLGPIAAVVIGGASLTGGLASPLSTWAAAFFLAGLSQMMLVMGLPTSLQFVVFGLVIIGGMLISGDRIIKTVERTLRERRRPRRTSPDMATSSAGGDG